MSRPYYRPNKIDPFTKSRSCLFTPRIKTGERLHLRASVADMKKIRSVRFTPIVVTDIESGFQYSVRGASCGNACRCDAIADRVLTSGAGKSHSTTYRRCRERQDHA
jgi:hypothetical protein